MGGRGRSPGRLRLEDRQLAGALLLLSSVVQPEHGLVLHPGQQEDLLDPHVLRTQPSSLCRAIAIFAVGGRCYWPPVLPHEIVVLEVEGRVKIRDDGCETGCRTGERGGRRAVERADYTVSLTGVYEVGWPGQGGRGRRAVIGKTDRLPGVPGLRRGWRALTPWG